LASLLIEGRVPYAVSPELAASALEMIHLDLGGWAAVQWKLPQFVATVCLDHHSTGLDATPRRRSCSSCASSSRSTSSTPGPRTRRRP